MFQKHIHNVKFYQSPSQTDKTYASCPSQDGQDQRVLPVPFQNNSSVHKSSTIASPLFTFGPFLPSILKPLYQKSFQMSQKGHNPIPNIDWLHLKHILNEPK